MPTERLLVTCNKELPITTSEARIAANRRNATRSTGPRTPEGKLQARRNALRHGLASLTLKDPKGCLETDRLAAQLIAAYPRRVTPEEARALAAAKIALDRVRAAQQAYWDRMAAAGPGAVATSVGAAAMDKETAMQPVRFGDLVADLLRLDRYLHRATIRWRELLKATFDK